MHERWLREREADEVAATLGLAFRDPQHGICHWHGNGAEFRAGYWAGKDAPRCAQDLIDSQAVGAAVAAEREECAQLLDGIANECDFDPEGLRTLRAAITDIRARGEPHGQSSKG